MKKNTHPPYVKAKVECACGNTFDTYSVVGDYKVDICNECHPFYTGKVKVNRVAGRVEKFNKKYGINQ